MENAHENAQVYIAVQERVILELALTATSVF